MKADWVAQDDVLAEQAVGVAAGHRLRGRDAVYTAVAVRFGSTLVTLDREQGKRVAEAVVCRSPAQVLVAWS